MTTAALVPAAGLGLRLGGGDPKALRLLAGEPMLVHAVRSLVSAQVDVVVIAAPAAAVRGVAELLAAAVGHAVLVVVPGGATRQESVEAALREVPPDVDVVLVHDAARPLVPTHVVSAVVNAVRAGHPAVIPALPLVDTVKSVDAEERVTGTPDRSRLRAVQTPQGFDRVTLQRAHAAARERGDVDVTDDAGLVERLGLPVLVVPGHELAFKVTRPLDLLLAEAVLAQVMPAAAAADQVAALEGTVQP